MRETYLTALNILYQIKEGDNYPFQPNINKNYFNFYNQCKILSNRIKKINYKKKNQKSNQHLSQSFSVSNQNKNLNNNGKKELNKYKEEKNKEDEDIIKNYYLNTYHKNSNFTNFKNNIKKPIQKSKLTKPINFFNKSNDYKKVKNKNFIKINKELSINNRYNSFKIIEQPNLYMLTNTKPSVELSTKVSSPKSIINTNTKNEEKENNYQNTKQLYNKFLSLRGNKKNSSSINFPSDKSYLQENFKKNENSKSNKLIKIPAFSYLMDKNSIEKNSTNKSGPFIIYDNLNNFSDSISTLKNSKDLNIKNNFYNENSKLKSDSPLNKENKFKNPKNLKLNLQDLNERKNNEKNDNKNYFIYSDNFILKSNYTQSSGLITLQSVSDEKLFNQANDYLTSDRSLESFKRYLNKNKKKKKSNKNK